MRIVVTASGLDEVFVIFVKDLALMAVMEDTK
jgi:hypothetical protein